ncbi:MAG: amidohydrolase [Thermoprotei archaeon]|nr:amidohydrolase [Thermoprotei archaeon]
MVGAKGLWIVDFHTHLGDFPLFNVRLNAEELIDLMNANGIERAVVFSLPNELTLNAVKRYPDRLLGFVWVNPKEEASVSLVRKAVNEWGFRGVKLHPLIDGYLPDDPIVYPIMEEASRLRIPVIFHSGHPPWSLPWHYGNLADRFPDVTIVLGHMGHGHIVYINASIDIARKHENVVLETSGMPMHSKIKEAVERVGVTRVVYGSDAPFGHPAFEILKVKVSGLTDEELRMVLRENALKLLSSGSG